MEMIGLCNNFITPYCDINQNYEDEANFKIPHETTFSIEDQAYPAALLAKHDVGRVIGDGNFAVVRECIDRTTRQSFALKIIDKAKCRGKEQMIENEVSILRRVSHPNIVLLLEEYNTSSQLYLIMELIRGGDLFDAISSATKYTEKDASGMVLNLAGALQYLHALSIVHRDIKPENLLVVEHEDGSKSLKLCDFGLAVEVREPLYTVCGTPTYVAPEILSETGYDTKVDIWATGIIAYILLCGFPPFVSDSNNQDELFDQILSGQFEYTSPYWDDVSTSAKELINLMLQTDPLKRITASQILNHPWIAANTALENDMHVTVAQRLNHHFRSKSPPANSVSPGIALIAVDHEYEYLSAY